MSSVGPRATPPVSALSLAARWVTQSAESGEHLATLQVAPGLTGTNTHTQTHRQTLSLVLSLNKREVYKRLKKVFHFHSSPALMRMVQNTVVVISCLVLLFYL